MNRIAFIYYIIFYSSILLANSVSYTNLIQTYDKMRAEMVIINLPDKNDINILQMCNKLEDAKVSLTDAQSAYLVYRWIQKNIVYDENQNDEKVVNVYNFGKANSAGISALFNLFCSYVKIQSGSISGYLKIETNNYEDMISNIPFTWNYIVIGDSYYPVDATLSRGNFERGEFWEDYNDIYFGTKPEMFIFTHYPHDSQWQLLSTPYTFERFDSLPLTKNYFYYYGFLSFSPEYKEITGNGEIIITLTHDQSIKELYPSNYKISKSGETIIDLWTEVKISNGKFEYILDKDNEQIEYFVITSAYTSYSSDRDILVYKLN